VILDAEDVIQVGEAEVESSQNVFCEALEHLGGFAQAKGHEGELEKAKWSGSGSVLYIVGMDGDLVVCCHQVNLGENGTTKKLMGVIVNMTDRITVWDCPGVECPVVAARAPTIVFLGYDV
jgi:hypothetical protein